MESSAVGDALGVWEAIALGAMQGLTEFLPISSSGHLALCQYFLGLRDVPRFFDVMLHLGTLAAVIAYYRSSLWGFARRAVGSASAGEETSAAEADHDGILSGLSSRRCVGLVAYLILATIPAVAAALVFRPTKGPETADVSWRQQVGNLREDSPNRPGTVAGFLTITGIILVAGSQARGGAVDARHMTWRQALCLGVAQAFSAMCPGISRSGATISTGMLVGLRGEWAVHFSLLMSLPAIGGAVALKTFDLDPAWFTPGNAFATFLGTITSAVVGWFCITLLLRSVRKARWWWFAVYVWLVALGVALSLTAG